MRSRWGMGTDARIGWMLAAAMAAMPCAATAADGARILYFEPLRTLTAPAHSEAGLRAAKATSSDSRQLSFEAYGRRFDLSLDSNGRLLEQLQSKPTSGSVQLYRGHIDGLSQSWVRLATKSDAVHGMIWDGRELYVIEPAAAVADALVGAAGGAPEGSVIFRLSDVLMPPGAAACASDTAAPQQKGAEAFDSLMHELKNAPVMMQAAGATRRLTISVLGDSQFLGNYANEQLARDALLLRLNNIDGIFSAQLGIEIQVDGVFVNDATRDPLSDAAGANSLLEELGELRRRSPELRSRGLTHLFTGRDLTGSTIGIAYLDSLCHPEHGAALTQSQSAWRDSLVAAHEIGHNFGADHDGEGSCPATPSSGYLMSSSVSDSSSFSQCSLDRMRSRARAARCITGLPPADIALPADLGSIRQPLNTTFEWQLAITNVGGLAASDARAQILLPTTLEVLEAYVVGGSCTSGGGVISCLLGEVAGGTSRTISVSLRGAVVGSNTVSASVTAGNENNGANNNGSGTIAIGPEQTAPATGQPPSSASQGGGGGSTDALMLLGLLGLLGLGCMHRRGQTARP
jgi:Metallo-peptidase family M12/Domain of unknown function DUF11/Reprolysin family propeptide